MTKNIKIGGKEVPMRASAAIPRLYRIKFGRDVLRDMTEINKAVKKGDTLPVQMLQTFEDLAYMMAKHADPDVPADPNEWLDSFETFDVYEAMPQITELWAKNMEGMENPKKKHGKQKGR